MACALTQGYNLDCRDSLGGLKTIYIIELENVSSVAIASGTVTGITKLSSKRFWKYNLEMGTSNTAETITGSRENGTVFYAQAVTAVLNKQQSSVRNEIKLLAQNRLMVVAVDRNNNSWLYGYEFGLMLNAGDITSGTASGDRNGYSLPFNGEEREPAYAVSSAVISTLETPGS